MGNFLDNQVQHIRSFLAGIFPKKRNYRNTIYINKSNQRLHYYDKDGNLIINSPVSTGAIPGNKTSQGDLKTPEGQFKISYSTDKADKNKFGDTLFYGLSYGSGIGIHGDANNPGAIGRRASHGCIRMPNGQLRCLQKHIGTGVGIPVIIEKKGGLIPKYQTAFAKLPEITVTAIDTKRFDKDSDAYKFAKALNSNRNLFIDKYNLNDKQFADFSKFAINQAALESKLGTTIKYKIKNNVPDWFLHFGKELFRGKDSPNSRGLTQIKYNQDINNNSLKSQYDEMGITDTNLQEDVDKMAKATLIRSIYSNNFLKQENQNKPYTYSNGKIIPQDEALSIYWNRGKLTSGLNPDPISSNNDVSNYVKKFRKRKVIQ